MRLLRICLLAIPLFVPSGLHAQAPPELAPGARVRVWLTPPGTDGAPSRPALVGTLVQVPSDSLALRLHPSIAPVVVASGTVDRLDLSLGVSRRRSGLRLALLGAVAWSAEFALIQDLGTRPLFESPGQAAVIGALSGALTGAVWGTLFPSERWRRLR